VNVPATVAARGAFVSPMAVTLWLELFGVACAALLVLAALAWWEHRRTMPTAPVPVPRPRRLTSAEIARICADADALNQHAARSAAAAFAAESALASAQARSAAARDARERAWQEYDVAQRAYVIGLRSGSIGDSLWPAVTTTGAWPVLVAGAAADPPPPDTAAAIDPAPGAAVDQGATPAVAVPTRDTAAPGLPAVRGWMGPSVEHQIARAALAAYRRGDLTVDQLREVYQRFSGWDRYQDRHEREVLRRRAAEREAHRRYDAAAAAERLADHAVDVAVVAARALADEATDAAEEAHAARILANECLRTAAGRRLRRSRRPLPAQQPEPVDRGLVGALGDQLT
jgi:hypothetical protein